MKKLKPDQRGGLVFVIIVLLVTWQMPNVDAAVSRLKTWIAAETLNASDLNAEFNNVLNNGEDLAWPATKAKDLDGQQLTLDSDADSTLTADTDDRLDIALGGVDLFRFVGTVATPANGMDFIATATNSPPTIRAQGSDANLGLRFEDDNANQLLVLSAVASAVNEINIENAITAENPEIQATGGDTNISIDLIPKGTGRVLEAGTNLMKEVITTRGDIIRGSSTGAAERLAVGTTLQFLGNDGTDVSWETLPVASDSVAGVLDTAIQSEQETGTATNKIVTPGRQHFHSSAAKAWIQFEQIGTHSILASYNITSITDAGVGRTTITIATNFSSANYAAAGMAGRGVAASADVGITGPNATDPTAGAFEIVVVDSAGTPLDGEFVQVVFFGDL